MKNLLQALQGKHTLVFIDFEGTQFTHEVIASGVVKAHIDDEGNIIDFDENGLLIYTKPRCSVGKIVTKMTSITDEFLKENGISWKETIDIINDYLKDEDENEILFVAFGPNDAKMMLESNRFSKPENVEISASWLTKFFDLMTFMSQYIRDDNGNTYSLVNFLKLYNVEPVGESHNPRNDAMDLLNLYRAFVSNPDVVFNEYLKVVRKMKIFPSPIKKVINALIDGKDVTSEEFKERIRKYLA